MASNGARHLSLWSLLQNRKHQGLRLYNPGGFAYLLN